MDPLTGETYWIVRFLFQRGLAFIYLLAFLVAANQFRPLAGEQGLLPIDRYAENAQFSERPSLFYFYPSDRIIGIAAWSGVVLSVLALFGVPYLLPEPFPLIASMILWSLLWVLYLSFVNAGQLFYGYGWESMLLETGFLAIFLGAGVSEPPFLIILLIQWVLFRNMFGAGLIKARGDDCWRELTCLDHHYETQPMPNPLSWFVHHLPKPFHRAEVLGNHIVELAIPFLYFAPQPYGAIAGAITIGFQLWLMLTGNFAWLNALTIVQAIATFSDDVIRNIPTVDSPESTSTPIALEVVAVGVTVLVVALSIRPVMNMLSETQVMNTSFDPVNLVNTYGAFGSITKNRYQLVIEGTNKSNPEESDWKEYEFKGQPGKTDKRPPQWAPYHLRLDWQLWFAAMRSRPGPRQRWIYPLLAALVRNDEGKLKLIDHNPYPDNPPEKVRIKRYRYRYTSPEERRESGDWWHRTAVGTYIQAVTVDEIRQHPYAREYFNK